MADRDRIGLANEEKANYSNVPRPSRDTVYNCLNDYFLLKNQILLTLCKTDDIMAI